MKTLTYNYLGHTRAWWVVLAVGIMTVIAGFAYWFWPVAGYAAASQIFGWLLILVGIVQLCVATGADRARGWGWWLAAGVINIFIGFMLVRSIILSAAVLPYFLSFVFIFQGIQTIVQACYQKRRSYRWLGVVNGVLMSLIGFFFLEAGWVSDMLMVSFLTSIAFIYWGFTLTITSFDLRPAGNAN